MQEAELGLCAMLWRRCHLCRAKLREYFRDSSEKRLKLDAEALANTVQSERL